MNVLGGMQNVLLAAYPFHVWDNNKLAAIKKPSRSHRWLKLVVQRVLPENTSVLEEFAFKTPGHQFAIVDLFIPEYKLAVEYHGEHHYENVVGDMKRDSKLVHHTDETKKSLIELLGFKYLEIPHWWDGQHESLSIMLKQVLEKTQP